MLIPIRFSCGDDDVCPTIYRDPASPDTVVVQGYATSESDLVRVPAESARRLGISVADEADVLVRGRPITGADAEAVPPGEARVRLTVEAARRAGIPTTAEVLA